MKIIYCFFSVFLVVFLAACAGPQEQSSGISHFALDEKEFGIGEFFSTEREVSSITVDLLDNARYEVVYAFVKEGGEMMKIAFYRTSRLLGESAADTQNRLQEIQRAIVKDANLPAIEDQFWYNKKTDKVSMLIFKKNI